VDASAAGHSSIRKCAHIDEGEPGIARPRNKGLTPFEKIAPNREDNRRADLNDEARTGFFIDVWQLFQYMDNFLRH
jgi:hypothetical protein